MTRADFEAYVGTLAGGCHKHPRRRFYAAYPEYIALPTLDLVACLTEAWWAVIV